MAKKNKYPDNRDNASKAMQEGKISFSNYTTQKQTVITINDDINQPNILHDLICAMDEVLKHHGH